MQRAMDRIPMRISMDDDIDEFVSYNPKTDKLNKYELLISHEEVERLAAQGKSMAQIAKKIGVSESEFYNWSMKYSGLRDAFRRGREIWYAKKNHEVEKALLKRAKGFRAKEKEVLVTPRGKRVKEKTVYFPPSEKAAELWLTNRAPEQWKKRQEIDVQGGIEIVFRNFEDVVDVDPIGEVEPGQVDFDLPEPGAADDRE